MGGRAWEQPWVQEKESVCVSLVGSVLRGVSGVERMGLGVSGG